MKFAGRLDEISQGTHKVSLTQDQVNFPASNSKLFMIDRLHMSDAVYTYIGIKQLPIVSGRGRSGAGIGIWLKDSYISGADAGRILTKLHLDVIQRYYDEFDPQRISMARLNMPAAFPSIQALQSDIESVEKPLTSKPALGVGNAKVNYRTIDVSSLQKSLGGVDRALDVAQLINGQTFVVDEKDMREALKFAPNVMTSDEFITLSQSLPVESGLAVKSTNDSPSPKALETEFDRVTDEIFSRLAGISKMRLSPGQQNALRQRLVTHIRSLGGEQPEPEA